MGLKSILPSSTRPASADRSEAGEKHGCYSFLPKEEVAESLSGEEQNPCSIKGKRREINVEVRWERRYTAVGLRQAVQSR